MSTIWVPLVLGSASFGGTVPALKCCLTPRRCPEPPGAPRSETTAALPSPAPLAQGQLLLYQSRTWCSRPANDVPRCEKVPLRLLPNTHRLDLISARQLQKPQRELSGASHVLCVPGAHTQRFAPSPALPRAIRLWCHQGPLALDIPTNMGLG